MIKFLRNLKNRFECIAFLIITINSYSATQVVKVDLNLNSGVTLKEVGDSKAVLDIGYLTPGVNYTNLNLGKVIVEITQTVDSSDPGPCMLDGLDISTVNLNKLKGMNFGKTAETFQYHDSSGQNIRLSLRDVNVLGAEGDILETNDVEFVDRSCNTTDPDYIPGYMLTKLVYEFTLMANIGTASRGVVRGAVVNGSLTELSLKDLIKEQILSTIGSPYRRKR